MRKTKEVGNICKRRERKEGKEGEIPANEPRSWLTGYTIETRDANLTGRSGMLLRDRP